MSRADPNAPTWWSYSQLKLYTTCPLKYRWQRIEHRWVTLPDDKPPRAAFIGTLFARMTELLYRERWWTLPDDTCLALLRGKLLQIAKLVTVSDEIRWPEGEQEQAIGVVDDALPHVLATMRNERLVGASNWAEYEIVVPLDNGDQVTGTADLVTQAPDGLLTMVDGKSGSPRYAARDQLRLYALGLLHDPRFQRLPDRVGFWFFREARVAWKKQSIEVLGKFRAGVLETVQRLRSGDFEPAPSHSCGYCPFRYECTAGRDYLYSKVADRGLPEDTNLGQVEL